MLFRSHDMEVGNKRKGGTMEAVQMSNTLSSSNEDSDGCERACGCQGGDVVERILETMKNLGGTNLQRKVETLSALDVEFWGTTCYRHVRRIASMLGLQTMQLSQELLTKRVMAVQANVDTLGELVRGKDTYMWFRKNARLEHRR